jgi:hypothetical protein
LSTARGKGSTGCVKGHAYLKGAASAGGRPKGTTVRALASEASREARSDCSPRLSRRFERLMIEPRRGCAQRAAQRFSNVMMPGKSRMSDRPYFPHKLNLLESLSLETEKGGAASRHPWLLNCRRFLANLGVHFWTVYTTRLTLTFPPLSFALTWNTCNPRVERSNVPVHVIPPGPAGQVLALFLLGD